MKPVSIRFRCFGPYISQQTIFFDQLGKNGLFLICGETGSGKTTILDAMCCALYGSCSGDLRGELDAMRCRQADPKDSTEVEFVFESGGSRYRFKRTLIPRKSKSTDARITYNEDFFCGKEIDGTWIPLMDNCKKKNMNAKAAELIGLNLDQFRQVIILPQGKFETLLTSKSEDKEELLSSLFHTERWKIAVDRMAEELNARRDSIAREIQTIQDSLKRLEVPSVAELPEAVHQAAIALEEATGAENSAKEAKTQAQMLLNLSEAFRELDRRRKKLDQAKDNTLGDRELQVRLDLAVKAEKARKPHDEWEQAKAAWKQAEKRLKDAEVQRDRAEAVWKKAEADKSTHLALAPEQTRREEALQRMTALRTRYAEIETLQKEATAARIARDGEEKKLNSAVEAVRAEQEKLEQLEQAWNHAEDACRDISAAYRAAAVGHLAAALQEGEACPVCGSTHHPCPAKLPEGAVTGRDVEDAEKKVSKARKAFEAQKTAREQAEEKRREAELAYQRAKTDFDQADGALNHGLSQRDPEIKTLKELDDRSKSLKNEIGRYNETTEILKEAEKQFSVEFATKERTLKDRGKEKEDAEKEFRDKGAAWEQSLAETGLGTETQYNAMILPVDDQNEMRNTLSVHAAALKAAGEAVREQQEKLEGKIRPEAESAEKAFREAEEKLNAAISFRTLAENKKNSLEKEAAELIQLDAKVSERRNAFEADSQFVRVLRGSIGISIQRYVLGIRLGQVIAEANRLLSGIYGGRYRLHRTDESHGSAHKTGLELEVYDSLSDQYRSVCTLSGGEKFLVALSLAIGLCTVVQNEQKGVNLDAMFIDEGFGSLDQSSLGDALDILQGVQRGRGLVGIISHISLLEETIPAKIVIRKTEHGSQLTLLPG